MDKLEAGRASFERNIGAQTGRSFEDWVALVAAQGFARHGQMTAWLKSNHGLSHAHANHIAKRVLSDAAPPSPDDSVEHLFTGGKEGLRPLYDQVVGAVLAFGPDVEIAPKKANVSLRRRRQFALLQPTTRTRLDLGLILKGRAPGGRLEPSGAFNAMFTHRIKIAAAAEIDAEVLAWLREAYDEAV
jgi:hypothetical protein